MLGRRDEEQHVGQRTPAGGAPSRVGHRRCVGIYADDERLRLLCRGGEHVPAVSSAHIDGYVSMTVDQPSKVAGGELLNAVAANQAEHVTTLSRSISGGLPLFARLFVLDGADRGFAFGGYVTALRVAVPRNVDVDDPPKRSPKPQIHSKLSWAPQKK